MLVVLVRTLVIYSPTSSLLQLPLLRIAELRWNPTEGEDCTGLIYKLPIVNIFAPDYEVAMGLKLVLDYLPYRKGAVSRELKSKPTRFTHQN
jgi:hypothetical protein